jgi:hypothetical protein
LKKSALVSLRSSTGSPSGTQVAEYSGLRFALRFVTVGQLKPGALVPQFPVPSSVMWLKGDVMQVDASAECLGAFGSAG